MGSDTDAATSRSDDGERANSGQSGPEITSPAGPGGTAAPVQEAGADDGSADSSPAVATEKADPQTEAVPAVDGEERDGGPAEIPDADPGTESKVLAYVDEVKARNGSPPPDHKGNRPYDNEPTDEAAMRLPDSAPDGRQIEYTEYDLNPKVPGKPRDGERVVIGDDGSVYYTPDHYLTFERVRGGY